ncbi:hypothetical protein CR513_59042, partial [Mucuna pruriens]
MDICEGRDNTLRMMNERTKEEKPRGRFSTEDEGGGDLIKCSGKYCRSCCGGYVADCVAVCCCPCAVLHCFALAFLKGPYVVGRKCFGLWKKKKKKKNKTKTKNKNKGHHEDVVVVVETQIGTSNVSASVEQVDTFTLNATFDAEKVWRELYQIAHLDFGRVSSSHDE